MSVDLRSLSNIARVIVIPLIPVVRSPGSRRVQSRSNLQIRNLSRVPRTHRQKAFVCLLAHAKVGNTLKPSVSEMFWIAVRAMLLK